MSASTAPLQAPAPAARPVIVQPDGGRHVHAFGDHIQFLLSGDDTGGALALGLASTPAGHGPPPHVHHREAELFVVLEGELEFWAEGGAGGGTWTRVAPGGVVFLPADLPHTYRNVGSTPSRHLVLTTPAGFERFFSACGELFAAAGPGAPPDMDAIVRVSADHGIEYLVPLGGR